MDNYQLAQHFLDAAANVRKQMADLEASGKKISRDQLSDVALANRNFALIAQAHATLAVVDEMRKQNGNP